MPESQAVDCSFRDRCLDGSLFSTNCAGRIAQVFVLLSLVMVLESVARSRIAYALGETIAWMFRYAAW